ncbi:hypothetical protein [Butyrivibrio sp. XBB1001]|uniref:hypothetical protein n=1 Tax=Butyrivibrio sp. XBB1001 TaxID=1280682 RepID=UPI0004289C0B|nr:hypothetical protein [Butyrivibrio sp. XBB1001]
MKKRKMYIVLVLVVVLGILLLSQIAKNRGGINVKCNVEYPVPEKMVGYRQDDDRWKDIHLGESKYTMESSGCITTCIASAISETDNPLTPEETVTLLSENGVFDDDGNMQWSKLDSLPGFNAQVFSDLNSSYIDECLAQGRYPIVKVHRKSLFSYHHFVLIIGAENGQYICMDPLKDSYTTLKDYGNRIYSVRCVWYEGEN